MRQGGEICIAASEDYAGCCMPESGCQMTMDRRERGLQAGCESELAAVVPVREIDPAALSVLVKWANNAPVLRIVAVGRVSTDVVGLPHNLSIINSDADLYGAMNEGTNAARSRFLLFVGVDDRLIVDNVAAAIEALTAVSNETPLVVLPFRLGRRQRILKPVNGRLVAFHHQGVLFNRDALRGIGGYSRQYRMHSDLDAMFTLQKRAAARLIPVPLVEFRIGGMSTSGKNAGQSFKEITAIYKAHGVSRLETIYIVSMGYLMLHRVRYLLRQAFAS